jgi:Tfp pilus assembly protein PilN
VIVQAQSLLAAGDSGNLPDWAEWGVLGLVILGFVLRQLVPGWLYADVKVENQELRKENKEMVELVLSTQQSAIPALQEATKAVNEAMIEIRMLRQQTAQVHGSAQNPPTSGV